MEYNEDKVDEMVLALLCLTMFKEGPGWRAWKGVGRDDQAGAKLAREVFEKHFGKPC